LKSTGGRGAVYHLPGEILPTPEDVFGQKQEKQERSSSILNPSSSILPGKPLGLAKKRDSNGCLLSDQLPKPVIDALPSQILSFEKNWSDWRPRSRRASRMDIRIFLWQGSRLKPVHQRGARKTKTHEPPRPDTTSEATGLTWIDRLGYHIRHTIDFAPTTPGSCLFIKGGPARI